MEGFAQIRILSSDLGTPRCEFGVDERSSKRDRSSGSPGSEDEERRVDLLGDDVRIDKDAGADDASHNEHDRVEQAQAAEEARHQLI